MSVLLRVIAVWVLMSGLVSCAALNKSSEFFPLLSKRTGMQLPINSEIIAAVSFAREGITQEYLLALRTRQDSFTAALLTPQGIPLSSVEYKNGSRDISRQMVSQEPLSPGVLLDYFELIYREEYDIKAHLKNTWSIEADEGLRRFKLEGSAIDGHTGISIQLQGESPWYELVSLQDGYRNQSLSLRLLGISHVLPE